ncbi:MAG: hypothetical protein Q8830_04090, partial [Candidatus Phytoplasma australasiaticum]|nr:hypothetical protein [Candidatus Phytoplasma australasiaticum]
TNLNLGISTSIFFKLFSRAPLIIILSLETPKEGVIIHNAATSSLVREVKEKQSQDPILQ